MTFTGRIVAMGVVLAASALSAWAQIQGVTRIEGKVFDERNNPVSCKMIFISPSGKKVDISSKPDGTYLQTFNEAGNIRILFKGHTVYFQESSIEIPKNPKFQAIEKNFTVRAVVEGTELAAGRWFDNNAATVSNEGKGKLAEVIKTLSANPQMRIVISVAPDMDQTASAKVRIDAEYSKAMDAWSKAVKKLKKNQTAPPEPVKPEYPADPNGGLVESRIASVKAIMKEVGNGDERITYSAKPLPASAVVSTPIAKPVEAVTTDTKKKKGKGSKQPAAAVTPASTSAMSVPTHPTLVVAVGQVKKLF